MSAPSTSTASSDLGRTPRPRGGDPLAGALGRLGSGSRSPSSSASTTSNSSSRNGRSSTAEPRSRTLIGDPSSPTAAGTRCASGTICPVCRSSRSRRSCSSSSAGAERVELGLHLDDLLHAGQVDAVLLRQVLDLAEQLDVAIGIATGVARRPVRPQQSLPFVDPQGLRVHAGELGGHADHVDRALVVAFTIRPRSPPSRSLPGRPAANRPGPARAPRGAPSHASTASSARRRSP